MSTNGSPVYHGFWIDWSYGPIRGATLTVSLRDGSLISAFFVLFVSVATTRLWRVLSFIIHQTRVSHHSRDGLFYQQQLIFRNTTSPTEAAWAFASMIKYWRSRATRSFRRSIPWAALAFFCIIASTANGILSSQLIGPAGNTTLVDSPNCGVWYYRDDYANKVFEDRTGSMESILRSATYARSCYTDSQPQNQQTCKTYVVPRISYLHEANAQCPFAGEVCLSSDNAAYQMDTGSVDSHVALGINTPGKDRLTYRRMTSCSPLTTHGFVTVTADSNSTEEAVVQCNYGRISRQGPGNTTWEFQTGPWRAEIGYQLR